MIAKKYLDNFNARVIITNREKRGQKMGKLIEI